MRLSLLPALLVLYTPIARGQSLDLRSDTLVGAQGLRPVFGASDTRAQVPIWELLALSAEDLGVPGLGVELSGFAGVTLAASPLEAPGRDGNRGVGNLSVGLLRYKDPKARFELALGRQYLFAGAGRAEHLDGLSALVRLPGSLELTLFGGRTSPFQLDYQPASGGVPYPADERFAFSGWAVGGRAHVRLLEKLSAGVGFVHEGEGSRTARQVLVVDGGYWGSRKLEALAGVVLDTVALLPQEAWLQLTSRPRPRLKLTLDVTHLVPSLAIPKTSLFSVFALDAYQELALGVHVGLGELLSLGLEGGPRLFDGGDGGELRLGFNAAAEARLALGEIPGRLVGLRLEATGADGERLLQARLFALYHFARPVYLSGETHVLYLASDRSGAAASVFERRLEGSPLSFGGIGTLGYRFTSWLSAQVTGSAFSTPSAKHDLRVLGRLTVVASAGGGAGGKR